MNNPDQSPQALCQSCGMCCDGTLFSGVIIQPSEAEKLQADGFCIHQKREDRFGMRQPCSQLVDGSCQAYERRPDPCRDFQCQLHAEFVRREIEFETAVATIGEVRLQQANLRALIAVEFPQIATQNLHDAVKSILELSARDPAVFRRQHAELMLAIGVYTDRLRRRFKKVAPVRREGE